MKKRVLSSFLAVCLLLSIFSLPAHEQKFNQGSIATSETLKSSPRSSSCISTDV